MVLRSRYISSRIENPRKTPKECRFIVSLNADLWCCREEIEGYSSILNIPTSSPIESFPL